MVKVGGEGTRVTVAVADLQKGERRNIDRLSVITEAGVFSGTSKALFTS
ncbi:hypothetical protein SLEP1_g19465 [Rubroshorea leprosula]|uniref:Uncharacterized protein n=1 Tax=Rubroshorea leprosula TaxID=152421 RepID=A0AAV5J4Z3_9ROSI|nr:hypothetical protein SLEP1_g19465 [Rubroshorea leprosula]